MGAKSGGTGTMGYASGTTEGVVYFGSGNIQDVVSYDTPTADSEL
jgi:hypothetical protein